MNPGLRKEGSGGKPAGLAAMLVLGSFVLLAAPANAEPDVAAPPPAKDDPAVVSDDYQRSSRIYHLNWFEGSRSSRGEEIYLFKCWVCHNEYTTQQDNQPRAPSLEGLYKRSLMLTGRPATDEVVAEIIRTGTPRMPSFANDMTDEDLEQLLRYLREDCCWDEDNPPENPAYHPQSQ